MPASWSGSFPEIGAILRRLKADAWESNAFLLQFGSDLLVLPLHLRCHGGSALPQGRFEKAHRHLVDLQALTQRLESGAPYQVFQVSAGVSFRPACQALQVDIRGQWHLRGMNLEDAQTRFLVRHWHINQLIEASRPQQGRI